MKTVNIAINLYSFDELTEKAQRKAIDEHRQFLLSTMQPSDFISGDAEYDTPEKIQEAYDGEYKYYENDEEPIEESIEINEYMFFESGELANTVHYCGNHPLAGQEHFIFNGTHYTI